ncbi:hypothetical protein OCU04_001037, partial [Sclerotinia nivalis]
PIVNVSSIEIIKNIFVNNIGYRGGSIFDVNAAIQSKESTRLQGRSSKKSKSIGWNGIDKSEKQAPIVPRVLQRSMKQAERETLKKKFFREDEEMDVDENKEED